MSTAPAEMTPENAAKLREQFPPATVGKLPKPVRGDSQKGNCDVCGGWHGLPAVHVDYVGHAATTDRLLAVDPAWTWEPLALGTDGLPALDRGGNLWIRLTVCGVTRLGVGDGKSAKEAIGDAIRNAAMRFGVALDLWAKEDLAEIQNPTVRGQVGYDATATTPEVAHESRHAERLSAVPGDDPFYTTPPAGIPADRQRELAALLDAARVPDKASHVVAVVGREVASLAHLTEAEADALVADLTPRAESAADRPPESTPLPRPGPLMISAPQNRMLQGIYKDVPREDRLAEASSILGREVTTFKDVTRDEAKTLIDAKGASQ